MPKGKAMSGQEKRYKLDAQWPCTIRTIKDVIKQRALMGVPKPENPKDDDKLKRVIAAFNRDPNMIPSLEDQISSLKVKYIFMQKQLLLFELEGGCYAPYLCTSSNHYLS